MSPGDIFFVKAMIAFVLVAVTGMTGFWLWLRARARAGPELTKAIDSVREENAQLVADLSARVAELEERVDFTERRMVQEREPARLPQPPKARTPV
jgi:cytoskeletal protein RodZ